MLPIARRDVERLQQILATQPRLLDLGAPHRTQRALLHRSVIEEALTWLEIHGDRPDVIAHWRDLQAQRDHTVITPPQPGEPDNVVPFRRRPRRRRRRRPRHARPE
jgi:hypothetical protein